MEQGLHKRNKPPRKIRDFFISNFLHLHITFYTETVMVLKAIKHDLYDLCSLD